MSPAEPKQKEQAPGSSGLAKVAAQFVALTKKNFLVQRRNLAATIAQLFVGPLFIIVLFIISQAIKINQSGVQEIQFVTTPEAIEPAPRGPTCEGEGCYYFAYAPKTAATTAFVKVMQQVGDIKDSKVVGIEGDVNEWLLKNENKTKLVLHLPAGNNLFATPMFYAGSTPTPTFQYTIQMNQTAESSFFSQFGTDPEPMEIQYRAPLQMLVQTALLRYHNISEASVTTSYRNFPHPQILVGFDAMRDSGSALLFIAVAFNFVVQMFLIVDEKERKLRYAMEKVGMYDFLYWSSWYLFDCFINLLVVLMLMLFGVMFQFELFTENSAGLTFFHFWLCANAFTAVGFCLASLSSKAETATSIGLLYFCVCYLFGPNLFVIVFSSGNTDPFKILRDAALVIPTLGPAFLFFGGLGELISASSGQTATGMLWEDRVLNILPPSTDGESNEFTFEQFYTTSIIMIIYHLFLAWYLDNILPNAYGRKKSILFFLNPRYWLGHRVVIPKGSNYQYTPRLDEDIDVVEESKRIVGRAWSGEENAPAILLEGFSKTFYSGTCGGGIPFKAVDGITYGVDKNSAFVLLGHNGAGKTTTINMLVGNLDITSGTGLVAGYNAKTQMRAINQIMGVCPQHDILWPALTGEEHLELFCRLRGMNEDEVKRETDRRLKDVLLDAPKVRATPAGAYSGGMQRRLSIAISLIGNPKVVYLDEPTTGMDPVTRREVWDMIQKAKKGRVIILTTHSMEEADVLGDKIGVMSHGKIQAFGTSTRLKKRFGAGYKMTVFIEDPSKEEAAVDFLGKFVSTDSSGGEYEVNCKIESRVPRSEGLGPVLFLSLSKTEDELMMTSFFKALEEKKEELGIGDFSVGLSTLEEVFLELSKRDHFIPEVQDSSVEAIAVDKSATTTGQSMAEVPVSFQARALCIKTLQWQRRHKCQLMANLCFPIFICLIAFLIEILLVSAIREETLCGTGIKYKNCKEKGYNLSCVENLLSRQYKIKRPIPLDVGNIQYYVAGGIGINPNCGTDASNTRGCYRGLEKARFDSILSTNSKVSRTMTEDKDVKELYQRFRTLVASSKCKDNFNLRLTCSGRRAARGYCKGRRDRQACQIECREVNEVRNKAEAADEASIAAQSNPLSTCLPESSSRRRLSRDTKLNGRKTLELTESEKEYYDIYLKILDEKIECDSKFMDDLAKLVDNGATYIEPKLVSAQNTIQSSGVYQHISGTQAPYQLFPFQPLSEEPILDEGISDLLAAIREQLNKAGLTGFKAGAPGGPIAFCNSINAGGMYGDPNLKSNITRIFSKDSTDHALENFCDLMRYIDVARGLSFDVKGDRDKLDKELYERWGGEEVKFKEMYDKRKEVGYRWHYYDADFTAVDWKKYDDTKSQYDYVIYHNTTATQRDDTKNWMSLTQWYNNAILKKQIGKQSSMLTQPFPVKFECNRDAWLDDGMTGSKVVLNCPALLFSFLRLNIVDFFMQNFMPFFMIVYGYAMTVLLTYEKEHKLRIIMKMQGLKMSVYFWVNYFYFLAQFMMLCFTLSVFGWLAKTNLFRLHDYGVMLTFFFLWGNVLVAFFMTLATCFKSTRMAQTMTFMLILICIYVGSTVIASIVSNPNATEASFTLMMLVPPFVMIRLSNTYTLAAASIQKISMTNMSTINNGTISIGLNYLIAHWFVWMFLRWYLEQVLAVGYGTTRHPLFIFTAEFWNEEVFGRKSNNKNVDMDVSKLKQLPASEIENGLVLPPDVEAEHARIIKALESKDYETDALRVVNIHKKFMGSGKTPSKTAVRSVSFGVKSRECFGLLGHNGAGKTTVINMMTGLFPPTSGTGIVGHYDIRNNMARIYSQMGICPQHNILWGDLTAKNHQYFFGRLKGRSGAALRSEVERNLKAVNLDDVTLEKRMSSGFSGGMQRRLSVANSIVGNPSVVYMDEPSTGLDPASRRQLWDVISRAKRDKSVVLTTHSMEEADVLCDRLGIMSGGRLLCLGPAYDLKRRFGKGYTCVLTTKVKDLSNRDIIENWMKSMFPSASLLEEPLSGTFKYEISRQDVVVSDAFEKIVTGKAEVGVTDWGFTETTLEEVFLKLSHLHGNDNPVDELAQVNSADNVREVELTVQKS